MKIASIKTKVNGEWKPALIDHTKVDGVWKDVVAVWTKIAGEWVSDLRDVTFNVTEQLTLANGIYILLTENRVATKSEYTASLKDDVVGVLVYTYDCKFVISPTHTKRQRMWSTTKTLVNDIATFTTKAEAKLDYDGYNNTAGIIEQLGTEETLAARDCYDYVFKNGEHGYLGSLGEWNTALSYKAEIDECLSLIEGDPINISYDMWTSTQVAAASAWGLFWSTEAITKYNKTVYTLDARPICKPHGMFKPITTSTDVTISINGKQITGSSTLTVPVRANHTYTYTVSKEGFTPVEGTITSEDTNVDVLLEPDIKVANNLIRFTYYSNSQAEFWTVPEGVTELDVFLVGAGGGGAQADNYYKAGSGGGFTKTYKGHGYVAPESGTWEGTATEGRDGNAVQVTPGETIRIWVGKGGDPNKNGGNTTVYTNSTTLMAYGGRCGSYSSSVASPMGGYGGSGGGAYGARGGKDGADGNASGHGTPGWGQGHTTRDFGEPTGTPNAAGSIGDSSLTDTSMGGYTEGSGGGNKNSGYGGGGRGMDTGYSGGDGTVLIRFYKQD